MSFDVHDIEQDQLISDLRNQIRENKLRFEAELARLHDNAGKFTIDQLKALLPLAVLLTGVAAMWLQTGTEEIRSNQALLQETSRNRQETINSIRQSISELKDNVILASKDLNVPIEKDIARLFVDIKTLGDEVTKLQAALSKTLNQDALEERFAAILLQLEALQGQVNRIITDRIQPLISKNSKGTENNQQQIVELWKALSRVEQEVSYNNKPK